MRSVNSFIPCRAWSFDASVLASAAIALAYIKPHATHRRISEDVFPLSRHSAGDDRARAHRGAWRRNGDDSRQAERAWSAAATVGGILLSIAAAHVAAVRHGLLPMGQALE